MQGFGFLIEAWDMKTKGRNRRRATRRTTAAEREEILREYRESGLSRREFARRRGINPLTFHGWFRKRAAIPGGSGKTAFVRVAVKAGPENGPALSAEYTSGVRIRMEGLSLRQAAELLREVAAC